jgi:hypothetical protein
MRTTDDIIRMAQPKTPHQERLLRLFAELVHNHPETIGEVTALVYTGVRANERAGETKAASVKAACHRVRWDSRVHINEDIIALLARAVLYVHPDLLGAVEVGRSVLFDEMLAMRVADKRLPGDYARRLEWSDGTSLSEPHPAVRAGKPVQVRPAAQGELFEVTA